MLEILPFDVEQVIDNRNQRLDLVLKKILSDDDKKVRYFDMAVGYFYLSGLLLIKDEFLKFMNESNGKVRIIMGNETNNNTKKTLGKGYDTLISKDDELIVNEEYQSHVLQNIANDTDAIVMTDKDFIERFIQWIREKRILVKVYIGKANYFHAKSYMFYPRFKSKDGQAIVGSSNFSRNGLQGNTELNVYSQDNFHALNRWFDTIWESSEVEDFSEEFITAIDEALPKYKEEKMYMPTRETYYKFAGMYSHPYAELDHSDYWNNLYPHQKVGVINIEDKINRFGTAILSDGVGMGKTRTAAGIIRLALNRNLETKTLIMADKKLQVQWKEELDILSVYEKNYDFISRHEFTYYNKKKLDELALKYNLIIIDEAHLGFKNRSTKVYRHVKYIHEKSNRKIKGLLLTATPWNNSREDVINLGSLFLSIEDIPQDRMYKQFFLRRSRLGKIIRKVSENDQAFKEFWEDLFLQRTRKTYGDKGVSFANREFPAVEVPYEPAKERIFSDNFENISDLKFPYMDIMRYLDVERNDIGSERLRLMLLKRADSSWIAYVNSLKNIIENTYKLKQDIDAVEKAPNLLKAFKNYISERVGVDEYWYKNKLSLFNVSDYTETTEFEEQSEFKKRQYIQDAMERIDNIKTNDAKRAISHMKKSSNNDISILEVLINQVESSYKRIDEKYNTVRNCIIKELSKGHKVILVSQFKDSANYYYSKFLEEMVIPSDSIGLVTGVEEINRIGNNIVTKKEILDRFSPKSKNRPDYIGTDKEINLIVGTDTISTGQNLQDAVVLMNLDLPYNPMILEQRIGRIDRPRPNTKISEVYIYTFPSYQAIEAELKMTERVGTKMMGVYEDTKFDSIVLPSYRKYLEVAQKKKNNAGNAIEEMLDETLAQTIYNPILNSEKHTMAYQQANRRMYDMHSEKIEPLGDVVHQDISFSNGEDNRSVAVAKVIFKDVNGSEISAENIIVDASTGNLIDVVIAEKYLFSEIGSSLRTTADLPEDKSVLLKNELTKILERAKFLVIKKYNNEISQINDSIDDMKDKTSHKAAQNIIDSVRNTKNRQMIISKISEVGMKPKDISILAKNIETIGKDDGELYEAVKDIVNDINRFWLRFSDYAQLFDIDNIETSIGTKIKEVNQKPADENESEVQLLVANLIVNDANDRK